MLFGTPSIIVLVISVVSGLRNCNDCTEILHCKDAMKLMRAGISETAYKDIKKSLCAYRKVCCSDFSNNSQKTIDPKNENENEIYNGIYDEDEIENHPKIHLIPDDCGISEGSRIIGGKRAQLNEYPWLALISHRVNGETQFGCGGTVINDRYVLTAAHCIRGKDIVDVRIGEYDISSKYDCTGYRNFRRCQRNLQDIGVLKSFVHPDYVRTPTVLNDIGLLRLENSVNLSVVNAGTSCLPWRRHHREINIVGERGIIAGWGATDDGTKSEVLLKGEIPVLDKNTCKSHHERTFKSSKKVFKSTFCAGGSGYSVCGGDSGGPLMVEALYNNQSYRLIQFGLLSYGPVKCGSGIPGVFTDVRKFMKWILDTIQP